MLTKLHVRGFKCLRDVTVDFAPLTVIIGKNDTGKTSVLEAIHHLSQLAAGTLELTAPWTVENLAWHGAPPSIEWTATVSAQGGSSSTYKLTIEPPLGEEGYYVAAEALNFNEGSDSHITWGGEGVTADVVSLKDGPEFRDQIRQRSRTGLASARRFRGMPGIASTAAALRSTQLYRFDARNLARASFFQPEHPNERPRLRPDGSGLPSVIDYLLGTDRDRFDAIESELCAALPHIKHILVRPWALPKGPGKAIAFALSSGGEPIPAPLASDGAVLMLAYLTLAYGEAPAILLLEEPENGIHPRALERVAGYLRKLTSQSQRQVQVIVVTHSPYFLDLVPVEVVRVAGRRQNGETVLVPLADLPGVRERLAGGFSLGELWFNVGEDDLLKSFVS